MYYFKRNTQARFLSDQGIQYDFPLYPDVSFSQVFAEEELRKKTLHNPENLISGGFTSSLNVGNFNFTFPLVEDALTEGFLASLIETNVNHTIWINSEGDTLKLNKCVVTGIVFNTVKNDVLTLSVSGNYSNSETVAPIAIGKDFDYNHSYIEGIEVTAFGVVQEQLNSFNLELSNDVQWLNNNTMHSTSPTFRTNYYTEGRTISGTVVKYDDLSHPTYSDNSPLYVELKARNQTYLEFEFPSIIITTRNQLDDVIKTGMDFRVNQNELNEIRYKGVNIL